MLIGVGKLIFYVIALILSMMSLWFVKWNKLFVGDNKIMAYILYMLCSIALAYLVGSFFIEIASIK